LYAQYELIEPWLANRSAPAGSRAAQSPEERAKLDGRGVHSLLLLLDLVPELLVEQDRYLGPSILLQSYRWLADSRDQRTGERLDRLRPIPSLSDVHTIMNCTKTCPKGLNLRGAISNTKR